MMKAKINYLKINEKNDNIKLLQEAMRIVLVKTNLLKKNQ